MIESQSLQPRLPRRPLVLAAALIVVELLVIGVVFKHGIAFSCIDNWGVAACSTASRSLAALYCVIAALGLFAMLRPGLLRGLLGAAGEDPRPLALNLAGFALAMVPVLFLREGQGTRMILAAFACWGIGMALLLAGLMGWLARRALWSRFLARAGGALVLVVVAGALAPALAVRLQPLWQLDTIADLTFRAVNGLTVLFGYDLVVDPVQKHIGVPDFMIAVAPVCSGIEGIALVTIFVSLYLWLFRAELRFPHALLLYPLGIVASAVLNVVRITALLILGIEGQPDLAVGGFHSHAGWVMFTLVALGVIALARRVPVLHRSEAGETGPGRGLPLRSDPVAARILPFAVFMLTAVVAPAISQSPALFYPTRVVLLAAVLALVWPMLRGIDLRVSPLSWLAGAVVGLIWVAIPVEHPATPPYGALTGGALLLWYIFRGIGTVLLVPVVEELFFRDYLEGRLRGAPLAAPASPLRSAAAIFVTAALFAALHDRWIEAFLSGVLFSLLARRSGRISDAIAAHALANLVIFAVAVARGNLAII